VCRALEGAVRRAANEGKPLGNDGNDLLDEVANIDDRPG
jgi:hypothetical protein